MSKDYKTWSTNPDDNNQGDDLFNSTISPAQFLGSARDLQAEIAKLRDFTYQGVQTHKLIKNVNYQALLGQVVYVELTSDATSDFTIKAPVNPQDKDTFEVVYALKGTDKYKPIVDLGNGTTQDLSTFFGIRLHFEYKAGDNPAWNMSSVGRFIYDEASWDKANEDSGFKKTADTSLGDLKNVNTTGSTAGQALVVDSSGNWKPGNVSSSVDLSNYYKKSDANSKFATQIVKNDSEWSTTGGIPIPNNVKAMTKGSLLQWNGNLYSVNKEGTSLVQAPDLQPADYNLLIPNKHASWSSSYTKYAKGELVFHNNTWWRCKSNAINIEPSTSNTINWEKYEGVGNHEDWLRLDSGKIRSNSGNEITISTSMIDSDAITTDKIKDKNITSAKLADSVLQGYKKPADINLGDLKNVDTSSSTVGQALVLDKSGNWKPGDVSVDLSNYYNKTYIDNLDYSSPVLENSQSWNTANGDKIPQAIQTLKSGSFLRWNGNLFIVLEDGTSLGKSPDQLTSSEISSDYRMIVPRRHDSYSTSYTTYAPGELVFYNNGWWEVVNNSHNYPPVSPDSNNKWKKYEGSGNHEDNLRLDGSHIYTNSGHKAAHHKDLLSESSKDIYTSSGVNLTGSSAGDYARTDNDFALKAKRALFDNKPVMVRNGNNYVALSVDVNGDLSDSQATSKDSIVSVDTKSKKADGSLAHEGQLFLPDGSEFKSKYKTDVSYDSNSETLKIKVVK